LDPKRGLPPGSNTYLQPNHQTNNTNKSENNAE